MARQVKSNPANPDIFGEDVANLAWTAVGVALSGAVNDKVVAPLAQRVVPMGGSEAVSKAVDAATTVISGYGLGEVAGVVDRSVGRRLRYGGLLLGVGKVLSIIIPGFSLSASVPGFIQFPSLGGNGTPQKALPPGQSAQSPSPMPTLNYKGSGL